MRQRVPTDVEELIAEAAGLRRLAVRLVGESDADDVIQDAVVAGLEHAPRADRPVRAWLVRVVRNFAAGRHRVEGRRSAREAAAARSESLTATDDLVERMDAQRVVAEEVLRLDEPYRTAVLAVHFEGRSAEEHARALGVPSATVRSWLKRGLDALRARLDRRFGGDRAGWSACLAPLARVEAAAVPVAVLGVLTMKKLLVAAVAVVVALVLWSYRDERPDEDDVTSAGTEGVDLVATAVSAPTDVLVDTHGADDRTARASIEPAADVEPRTRVVGRLVWTPDREPAAGIGIFFSDGDAGPESGVPPLVTTAVDGTFEHVGSRGPTCTISLDRGWQSRTIALVAGETHEVELEIPRGIRVTGRVLDARGRPVGGAEVLVATLRETWETLVATTGADGTYSIDGMSVGPRLIARARGHAPSASYLLQSSESPSQLDLYLGLACGAIEGRVTDSAGQPRPGVHLRLRSAMSESSRDPAGVNASVQSIDHGVTDATGSFVFADVRTGMALLEVYPEARVTQTSTVDVRPDRTSRVDVVLPQSGRVHGRLTDSSGAPVQGARVQVVSNGLAVATTYIHSDSDGRYDTGAAPCGRLTLSAMHKSGSAGAEIELAAGEEHEWNAQLRSDGTIRGRVVDVDGRALSGVMVSFGTRGARTPTDSSGYFEVVARRTHVGTVYAWEGDVQRAAAHDVHPDGEDLELVWRVATGRVRGRWLGANGVRLSLRRAHADRSSVNLVPDRDQRFESELLDSGTYDITVDGQGVSMLRLARIDVCDGAVTDVGDLAPPPTGTAIVHLHGEDSIDLSRVHVVLVRSAATYETRFSRGENEHGRWTATGLPEGEYALQVRGGGVAARSSRFRVDAGRTSAVDVELRLGTPVRFLIAREPRVATKFRYRIVDAADALVAQSENELAPGATWSVHLEPGSYAVVLLGKSGPRSTTRFRVPSDPVNEVYVPIELR